ncbi:MAG: hypothetical protein ACK50J_16240 [Planctomyces sp.]
MMQARWGIFRGLQSGVTVAPRSAIAELSDQIQMTRRMIVG